MKKNESIVRDLAKLKLELLDRKREYEEELAKQYKEKFGIDEVQDPGDQASTSTLELLSNSLQNTNVHEYNRIINALEMIENGTYGICIDCHDPISQKRLKSYPDASRCIACQEIFEERERIDGVSQ